jgi:transcription elongation factor S-II
MPPPKASSKGFPVLIISQEGEIKAGKLKGAGSKPALTLDLIKSFYKKNADIDLVGSYPYKTSTIFLFGATSGAEGTENNHQLPPPYDINMVYGEIIVVASKDEGSFEVPVEFTTEEYEQFYSKSFGGYVSDEGGEAEGEAEAEVEAEPEAEGVEEEEGEVEAEPEDEEEEGEAEEEEEAAGEVGEDAEEAAVAPKPKQKKRRAVSKANATSNLITTLNTYAYPDKPILSEDAQLVADAPPTGVQVREHLLERLTAKFNTILTTKQLAEMEMCIYNGALQEAKKRSVVRSWNYPLFAHVYNMRARQIATNFDPASYVKNTDLFKMFKEGNLTFDMMAPMNCYELFPSKWKESFDLQQIRENKQLEGNRSMATDQFLCTRCWKRECTYYEMQTRSADEPMTIFITCINCGKHWRQ